MLLITYSSGYMEFLSKHVYIVREISVYVGGREIDI